jgi:glycosyltransferase involved in cell wall biosynthesis
VIVPVSAILPTRNRAPILSRFFDSLELQDAMPAEIVVCDGSEGIDTERVVTSRHEAWDGQYANRVHWQYLRAARVGLAPQRNQAVAAATQPFVWFLDDDMLLEPSCLRQLYGTISGGPSIGGVTATLANEPYHPPGRWTRALMRWFEDGRERQSYASACVGPGWTFLHDPEGPELTRAEWLGGGCTVYRKAALPVPAVPDHFEEGGIGEDLAASLTVGQHWQMYHVRDARAIHDSQGGTHKRSQRRIADQSLRNRWHIMTCVMGKRGPRDVLDFAAMHLFGLLSLALRRAPQRAFLPTLLGLATGTFKIMTSRA